MTAFGYVRVSSREQNEGRQLKALKEIGVLDKNIYIDKQSGKDFDRPQYKKMIRRMRSGDCLYIKSIDRLGRNYDAIIREWEKITKVKDVDVIVIDMPLLDTTKGKDLLGTFISDLVLQLLSFVAHMERDVIKQRQAEGIALAKAKGKKWGNTKKDLPDNFNMLYDKWQNEEITATELAQMCGMHRSTLYKRLNEEKVKLIAK